MESFLGQNGLSKWKTLPTLPTFQAKKPTFKSGFGHNDLLVYQVFLEKMAKCPLFFLNRSKNEKNRILKEFGLDFPVGKFFWIREKGGDLLREMEWIETFRINLIELMQERGYTQRDLAESTGLGEGTISRYLNGMRMPTVKSIVNLSYELGVDVADLVDFGDRIE